MTVYEILSMVIEKGKILSISIAGGVLIIVIKLLMLYWHFTSYELPFNITWSFKFFNLIDIIYPMVIFLSSVVLISKNKSRKIIALIFNVTSLILILTNIQLIIPGYLEIIYIIIHLILSVLLVIDRLYCLNKKYISIAGAVLFVLYNFSFVNEFDTIIGLVVYGISSLLIITFSFILALRIGIFYSFIFYSVTLLSYFIKYIPLDYILPLIWVANPNL